MVDKPTTPIGLNAGVESPAMSDHLVRVERLKQLQRERGWNDSELARQCNRTPQQIRSWWDPKGRQIGERLARSLEEDLKLPRYWLDERPTQEASLEVREGVGGYRATFKADSQPAAQLLGTAVPVIQWGQLPIMLLETNQRLPAGTPVLGTFAQTSSSSKFVAMPDDSMAPVFSQGDHILFEPAEVPHAGDTVLVRISTGEYFVRTFRPRSAHHWVAEPINSNYESLSTTDDDALTVVAVMTEHRRYRSRR